jgi:hypothetical protein
MSSPEVLAPFSLRTLLLSDQLSLRENGGCIFSGPQESDDNELSWVREHRSED